MIREQWEANGTALSWADASRYAELLLERSMETYQSANGKRGGPIFFDRGIGDALAYATMIRHRIAADIVEQAQALRYADPIFLAPWWPEIYETDDERRQSREEAERTEHAIAEMYCALGYRVVRLPLVSPAKRADFILEAAQPV